MEDKKRYYAIAGTNACGVYDDYDKVLESRKYLKKYKCKKCKTFEEAKEVALDMFYDLQNGLFTGISCESLKQINWCYYRKDNMDNSFV